MVADPPLIVEVKILGSSPAVALRQAVGQLYEYRYFQVVDPASELIILTDRELPEPLVRYLESDRKIGVCWQELGGWGFGPLARSLLT